jgi:hypothetical protein
MVFVGKWLCFHFKPKVCQDRMFGFYRFFGADQHECVHFLPYEVSFKWWLAAYFYQFQIAVEARFCNLDMTK